MQAAKSLDSACDHARTRQDACFWDTSLLLVDMSLVATLPRTYRWLGATAMASPTVARVCLGCLRQSASSPFRLQRRSLKRSHGPKYQAKIDAALEEWKERAQNIQDGEKPNVWDMFEERGFVKDVVGQVSELRWEAPGRERGS